MRCTLLLLFALIAPGVAAQTGAIAGSVRDAEGMPIPGAHVVLERGTRGTATDADGRFRIEGLPAGSFELSVSAVGFARRTVSVAVDAGTVSDVLVTLAELTLESAEVVVTALRRPEATSLVPVSVSLLTNEVLISRNVSSLDQALRIMPGVQMAENQVNVRGSSGFSYNVGSRVLLLVDGVPLLGPETGGIPFDAIPMAQIARIELVKGPGSAMYGSGALGGVLNVITRDFPETPQTDVSGFVGVHEPVRHRAWAEKWYPEGQAYRPLGGATLTHARRLGARAGGWVHASYRRDDGYLRLAADEVLQAYAKLGWDPSAAVSLRLLGGITARERDSFLYWSGLDDVLNPGTIDLLSPGSSDATGSNDNRSIQASILPTLRHTVGPRLVHHVRLRHFLIQIRPIDEFGRSRPLSRGTSGFRFGGEWQVDWTPAADTYVTAGLSADANAARSEFFRTESGGYVFAQPEYGAFAQYERRVAKRMSVLGGVRFDAYQVDSTTTSARFAPKLSVSYDLGAESGLRASYGQGFRVPGIAERYVDNQDFFPFFPNHDLRPELSSGYEVGLRLGREATRAVNLDVALFWNDYRRLVEPKFVTDPDRQGTLRPGFQFVNLTRARIRGLEATSSYSVSRRSSVQASYTLLDARDLTEDRSLAFRSAHLLKVTADVTVAGGLAVGLDYRYASRPDRVDTDFARFVPDADVMVPAHVVDVRTAISWRALTVAVHVLNALDYYYLERPAYLAPPRQVHALVRVRI